MRRLFRIFLLVVSSLRWIQQVGRRPNPSPTAHVSYSWIERDTSEATMARRKLMPSTALSLTQGSCSDYVVGLRSSQAQCGPEFYFCGPARHRLLLHQAAAH